MSVKQNNFHAPDPRKQGNGDGNEAAEVGAGTGDMLKSVYDNNDDGRVDSADHALTADTADEVTGIAGLSVYYGTDASGTPGFYQLPPFAPANTFVVQSDTPANYVGQSHKLVRVNFAETGLEFVAPSAGGGGASEFTELTDTPENYTSQALKLVRVNAAETDLEFTDPVTDTDTFTGLTDTPANYVGQGSKFVAVNSGATALEFVDAPSAGAFKGALITNTGVNLSTTFGAKTFATEDYDTDAFVDLGTDNDRITIPANVTKVQVTGHVDAGSFSNANHMQGVVRHYNSSDVLQGEYGNETRTGFALRAYVTCMTPVIEVSSGDYFQLWTDSQDSSTSANISLGLEYKDGTL